MNSYERTVAALKRQQPDRVPIFCYIDETSPAVSEKLRSFLVARGDLFYNRLLYTGFHLTGLEPAKTNKDLDDGWVETTYKFDGGAEFSEVLKSGEQADFVGYMKHLIDGPSDIKRILELPYVPPAQNSTLATYIDEVNAFGADHCADGSFFRIAFLGPLGTLAGSMGATEFAMLTIEDEDTMRRYLDVSLERQCEYLAYVLDHVEAPLIVNVGGAEYAIPPLMSPRSFHDYIKPYDNELIRVSHERDKVVYYHSHGKVRQFIPGFIEMGTDGLHPLEPIGATGDCELKEVKKLFGKDLCLVGNVQYDDLARLPLNRIEEVVQGVLQDAKEGGGLILSPTCTPYHNPMPAEVEENIMAFIEAGLRYGQY